MLTTEEMSRRIATAVADEMALRISERSVERMAQRIDALTAAGGQSWKWQLRDSKGQWVEMGSEVKWLANGKMYSGKVVGSPRAGVALVQDNEGRRVQLAANRLTATKASTQATPRTAAPQAKRSAPPKLSPGATKFEAAQTPKQRTALQDVVDIIEEDVAPENRQAALIAAGDIVTGYIAAKVPPAIKKHPFVQKVRMKGRAAIDKFDTFMINHERTSMVLEKLQMWADEFISEKFGGSTNSPGLGPAFMAIGLPNPFTEPVGFFTETAHHVHSIIELLSPIIHQLAGSAAKQEAHA